MTENPNAFKHWFSPELVENMAAALSATGAFDEAAFAGIVCAQLTALELKDRVRLISAALRDHLPDDYPKAIEQILATLPPIREDDAEVTGSIELWPYCHFVEEYGLEHLDVSMHAMFELTQRFSAEFAIRPYLLRYTDEVLAQLAAWTSHKNLHVRRWVSEGTRPRLPWGMRLQPFVDDPAPILPLLEALRHDPEEYVRRSVANNLNDIAKDHPDLVVEIATRWLEDANEDETRMVKHALRTLVKNGHGGALALLGYGRAQVTVARFEVDPTEAAMGSHVYLHLELESDADETQSLLIDYAVHHQRANGTTSPKVFKWTTREIEPGKPLKLKKKHSLRIVTTRKYYAGAHDVELLVNGESLATTTFDLRADE